MANHNALVVGNGGREHELARQLHMSGYSKIYWTQPNAGAEDLGRIAPVDLKPTDVNGITEFARQERPKLTVIGPEAPLAQGLADRLRADRLNVFGPSAEAAQLETSKIFATEFMQRHGIPMPPSWIVREREMGMKVVRNLGAEKSVIKADGLAAGKGVVLPKDEQEAEMALYDMLVNGGYDGAGLNGVVVQERYTGSELSVMVVSDGRKFQVLPTAQDHKRLLDADEGPNTGGMGAYAPVPSTIVGFGEEEQIYDIAQITIEQMAYEGRPFQGCLYLGLMLAEERSGKPVVIEYNARFGDPETEVILPILEHGGVDVAGMLQAAAEGRARDYRWDRELGGAALSVCLAAEGYPANPRRSDVINGLGNFYQNVIIHHAGTTRKDKNIETSGGRVLYVTGYGEEIDSAASAAYGAIGAHGVNFTGMQYRQDIGYQARLH